MSRCGEARLSKESLQLQLEKEFRSLRHRVANVVIHAETSRRFPSRPPVTLHFAPLRCKERNFPISLGNASFVPLVPAHCASGPPPNALPPPWIPERIEFSAAS